MSARSNTHYAAGQTSAERALDYGSRRSASLTSSEPTPANPKGILSSSPGLPQPWVRRVQRAQPQRGCGLARKDATPLGFWRVCWLSQGCRNPGLCVGIPLGFVPGRAGFEGNSKSLLSETKVALPRRIHP